MKISYYSIYGAHFEQFTILKRSLGYKYEEVEYVLGMFDKVALKREETSIGISRELSDEWCIKRPNESPKTWYSRIQMIRDFSSFLCASGYASHLPKLPKIRCTYTPYIFTKEQITSIFAASDQLKPSKRNLNSAVYIVPALMRLLYSTGVRISEAMSLCLDDMNLKEKYIILRQSKNGQDRIVPLSASMAIVCSEYMKIRDRLPLRKPTNRLFVLPDGTSFTIGSAYKSFRRILYNAGIPHAGKGLGPRMHDLRHTFSVHALASMAEAGLDLYYSLPVLSTYLGHKTIQSTDKYVRLTAEMYPSVIAKVNEACPHLFPEFYNNNENETN